VNSGTTKLEIVTRMVILTDCWSNAKATSSEAKIAWPLVFVMKIEILIFQIERATVTMIDRSTVTMIGPSAKGTGSVLLSETDCWVDSATMLRMR
jgi:hypothetical protein